jgi:multiple sugar transport system substrate-binding protein/sn-glycerol 3-phosphate transport system substrate-binding protein
MFSSQGNPLKKSLLMVFILSGLLFLAGCLPIHPATMAVSPTVGKAIDLATSTPTQTQVDIDVDVSKLKGMQLFFMHPWTGDLATLMDNLVSEFNQTNTWGIRVVVQAPGSSGSLMDTLNTDLQTSMPPEVIAAPIDDLLTLNRSEKNVVDLTPYVNSAKWGMDQSNIANYSTTFWNQDEVTGYRYGIPAQRTAKVLIYNKTWATELGYANPPTTPDEFKAQVCAANTALKLDNDVNNDGLGGWLVDTDAITIASWATTFGTSLEHAGKINFSSPQMTQTLTYLRNLLDQNCAWQGKDASPYKYFASRQTLVYSADLQELPLQQTAMQLSGSTDEWMVIPYPTQGKQFLLTDGPSYAIMVSSPEKQLAAWLFIRWLSSADHSGSVVKVSTTLPLGESLVNYSIELSDSLPQWQQAVDLLPYAQIAPVTADWPSAKVVLEDASWQLFQTNLTVAQIPDLTKQMDQTLDELIGTSP